MNKKFLVGSRASQLARIQVREVFDLLANKGTEISYELKTYLPRGDRDKITPLSSNPADDFFTDSLDQALLNNEIDIAIHSAKDLPRRMQKELLIFALTGSLDDSDAFVGPCLLRELKPGAKVGTSSALRKQAVKEINPAVELVDVRGHIEERLKLIKQGKIEGLIAATCALKRLGLSDQIREILPWEATPLQGQLAVVGRRTDLELGSRFAPIDIRKTYGRVWLVGAGPGDPDLISVKATKILEKADCVFYDYLIHTDLLDYCPQAEKVYVGKRKGDHAMPQAELSRKLRDQARRGLNVVRLKGGDPLIFGRGADEIQYLRSYHIEVEVVPGISSATGIPSSLGIPLTARGQSATVAFMSGYGESETETDPQKIDIPRTDTIVFLMGLTKLSMIVRSLIEAGWQKDTPMMIISNGTRIDEEIVTGSLGDIEERHAQHPLKPPALIIAGQTIKFRQEKTLEEKNILYLGTFPERYRRMGKIIPLPMIELQKAALSQADQDRLKASLADFDFILMTSRHAVKYFFQILKEEGISWLSSAIRFMTIGQETANTLRRYHFEPELIPETETGPGLFESMKKKYPLKGKKILFPRSALPNPFLKDKLTKAGANVWELVVYQNLKPEKMPLPRIKIDQILFTSPSTVRNFLEEYGTIPPLWNILAKGPRTQEALQEAGFHQAAVLTE